MRPANLSHLDERAFSKEGPSLRATLTGLEPATSAVTGRHANQLRYRAMCFVVWCCSAACSLTWSDPNGIRTRATAVKGRRPRPLNDGAEGMSRRTSLPTLKHKGCLRQIANRGRVCCRPGVFGETMGRLAMPSAVHPRPVADVKVVVSVAFVKPAEGAV